MSDFIESEAEESEEEFEEKDLKPKKTQRFMEEDGEIWVVLVLALYFSSDGLINSGYISVLTHQMRKKKKTLRTRMSREICVDSLMMETRKKKKVKEVQAAAGVTPKKN